jgi:hypothetical protein
METDQLREDNTADAACTPRQTEMMSGKSRISLPRLSRMTSIHEISHCIPPFQGMSHTKVGQYPDDLKDIWEELAIRVHTLFPLSNQEPKGVRFDGWALSPIFVDTHTQPTRSYRYSQAVNTTSALTNVMATSISSSPACSFKNNYLYNAVGLEIGEAPRPEDVDSSQAKHKKTNQVNTRQHNINNRAQDKHQS